MVVFRLGAHRCSPPGERRAFFEQLLLHAIAILFKPIVVAATVVGRMKKIEPFEDVVSERVATLGISQRRARPTLAFL